MPLPHVAKGFLTMAGHLIFLPPRVLHTTSSSSSVLSEFLPKAVGRRSETLASRQPGDTHAPWLFCPAPPSGYEQGPPRAESVGVGCMPARLADMQLDDLCFCVESSNFCNFADKLCYRHLAPKSTGPGGTPASILICGVWSRAMRVPGQLLGNHLFCCTPPASFLPPNTLLLDYSLVCQRKCATADHPQSVCMCVTQQIGTLQCSAWIPTWHRGIRIGFARLWSLLFMLQPLQASYMFESSCI